MHILHLLMFSYVSYLKGFYIIWKNNVQILKEIIKKYLYYNSIYSYNIFTIFIFILIFLYYFFFVQGRERMHLRTLCETRSKQYPLNSKLPCLLLLLYFITSLTSFTSLLQGHCLWAQFAVPRRSTLQACLAPFCSLHWLSLRIRHTKSCTPHGPREMISPGFVLSFGA